MVYWSSDSGFAGRYMNFRFFNELSVAHGLKTGQHSSLIFRG